jgi:hypothetical protein
MPVSVTPQWALAAAGVSAFMQKMAAKAPRLAQVCRDRRTPCLKESMMDMLPAEGRYEPYRL